MIDRKKLTLIIVFAVLGLLFFILVIISAFSSSKDTSSQPNITPTASKLIIPTSSSISIPTALPVSEGIQLVSTNPPDQSQNVDPIAQLSFSFSSPMNEKRFYYKTTPTTSTFIHTQGTTVVITPQTSWPIGINSLTVYEASESIDGTQLSTPFQYTFQVSEPTEPIPGTE